MELFLKAFIGLFLLIGTRCSENEFDYKELGPDYWKAKIPACNGSSQSPIDINTNSAVYEKKLASINFYNYSIQIRLNLTHNGHTVVAYQSDSKPVPYIMMNVPMSGTYTMVRFNLAQFHFHWGYNDYQGSEHYFNGNKYPLELHLVHKSSSGTLAVLGFLYELNGQNNTALNNVLTAVGLINQVNSVTTATFGLSSLLPNYSVLRSNGYFRYRGSLTAPPCSQNVIWTVFKTLNPVSSSQANLVDKICLLNRDLRRINSFEYFELMS